MHVEDIIFIHYTAEPRDHENYLVISGEKTEEKNIKNWDQQNDLVIRGFCSIRRGFCSMHVEDNIIFVHYYYAC